MIFLFLLNVRLVLFYTYGYLFYPVSVVLIIIVVVTEPSATNVLPFTTISKRHSTQRK